MRAPAFALLAAFSAVAAVVAVARAEAPATARGGPPSFHFFSPDWRPADLGALAAAFEKAVGSQDGVAFQGFARYDDFERQVVARPPDFVMAPAWFATSPAAARCTHLAVLARPLRNGRTSYRKALMTRSNLDSIDDLAQGTIAATLHSMSEGSPSAILEAFHLASDSARVVPVPKDVDALLALGFAQVDAALVTGAQYEELARRSPAEAEALRVLAFSPDIPMPPVFACRAAEASLREAMRDRLAGLAGSADGQAVLAMLGFDAFAGADGAAASAAGTARGAATGTGARR